FQAANSGKDFRQWVQEKGEIVEVKYPPKKSPEKFKAPIENFTALDLLYWGYDNSPDGDFVEKLKKMGVKRTSKKDSADPDSVERDLSEIQSSGKKETQPKSSQPGAGDQPQTTSKNVDEEKTPKSALPQPSKPSKTRDAKSDLEASKVLREAIQRGRLENQYDTSSGNLLHSGIAKKLEEDTYYWQL